MQPACSHAPLPSIQCRLIIGPVTPKTNIFLCLTKLFLSLNIPQQTIFPTPCIDFLKFYTTQIENSCFYEIHFYAKGTTKKLSLWLILKVQCQKYTDDSLLYGRLYEWNYNRKNESEVTKIYSKCMPKYFLLFTCCRKFGKFCL